MALLPMVGPVDHIICDPPYEQSLHDLKNNAKRRMRTDGGPELRGLDFAGIDAIRGDFIDLCAGLCRGWFVAFCTIEGVARWADVINPSPIKYKRACIWVKPDSLPQMNGQGPAQGAECFVTAWCGQGHAKWNAGGKRGVYTHLTNPPDRHGGHPTEKPWRLMSQIIADFTNPGDTILDPFMGSGTTLVATARMGRRAVGIETNPAYFDIAVSRVTDAHRQKDLFVAPPAPKASVQDVLI
ncbi:DNA-methyltransferase [Paracoccus sp. (in: a-proteobacteria)]|uniref:DNA-methyltransferase n=1 Tax=Paracoccus sp. TaxID=267 RepID=UPI003A837B3E